MCHENVASVLLYCTWPVKKLQPQYQKYIRMIYGQNQSKAHQDGQFGTFLSASQVLKQSDVKPLFNLWRSHICPVYLAHTPGQVSKFPSPHGLHETQQILTGARSRSVQWILTFSFQLGCVPPCRRNVCLPAAVFFYFIYVCEGMRVWVYRPGNMRRLLLLLLGLLLLQQGRCFEFVIDGEWEDEAVSWRVQSLRTTVCASFYLQNRA